MGSGKTTLAGLMSQELKSRGYTPVIQKFAQPLYDMQEYIYNRVGRSIPQPKDRKLLQWLGTEWGRSLDKDIWINLFELDARNTLFFNDDKIIICDDVRFDNEADIISKLGGVIIEIIASDKVKDQRLLRVNTGHASENGIDPIKIDITIKNNDSLFELEKSAKYISNIITDGFDFYQ